MLMNSVGFGQGTAEITSTIEMVCSLWFLRPHTEDKKAEGDLMEGIWNFVKAHSLTRLAVWLLAETSARTVCENFYTWAPCVAWLLHNTVLIKRERDRETGRQGEKEKEEEEREMGGRCVMFSNLVLEVTQHHFCHILFVQTVTGTAGSRGGEIDSTFLLDSGKVLEEHVEPDILLWLFLENTVFHRSLPVRASHDVLLSKQAIKSEKGT